MTYFAAEGEYPTSIEELVPDYLREIEDCPTRIEGRYSLDYSTEAPRARCSAHGTLDDYTKLPDNTQEDENSWFYPVLFSSAALLVLGGGIGFYIWMRKRRPQVEQQ